MTRRGKVVAKVIPPAPVNPSEIDWTNSAALNRKPCVYFLTVDQSAAILAESQGS